jgi:hypothetical protein
MIQYLCNVCSQPIPEGENGTYFKLSKTFRECNFTKYILIGIVNNEEKSVHICRKCFKAEAEAL